MQIVPSIDLMNGQVVRLRKGARQQVTHFSSEPVALVRTWHDAGVPLVHVVDLDAAFGVPTPENQRVLAALVNSSLHLQLGGGLRTPAEVEHAFATGIDRVVLGTAAVKEPHWVLAMCQKYPGRVVIALDARHDTVVVAGWTEASEMTPADLGRQAKVWGASAVLYTDIEKDGTHEGPNVTRTSALQKALAPMPVIASGGVGSLAHLQALRDAKIEAVVVGRALHEQRFNLAQALTVAQGRQL